MINQRLKNKYGYSIDQASLAKIYHQIYLHGDKSQIELKVDKVDLQDVLFVLKTKTDLYAMAIEGKEEDAIVNCIRLHHDVKFELIKDVNSENHPHIDSRIPKGTILSYSDQPNYGTVNRYKGLPLSVGNHFYQINYEFIELVDSGVEN